MRNPAPWQTKYDRMLMMALLFGLVGQYLLVGPTAGLSVPVFILGFYALFFYAIKGRTGGFEKWKGQFSSGWLLFLPITLLALTYALFANEFFRIWNGLALILLIAAQTMLLARGGSQPWHRLKFYREMAAQLLSAPLSHIKVPFSLANQRLRSNDRTNSTRVHIRKIGFGLLLAAPLLIVVVTLLASADLIFSSWLNRIPELLHLGVVGPGIKRLVIGLLIALYVFCYIWSLLFRKAAQQPQIEEPAVPKERYAFDFLSAATLLVCVNAVYVLFAAIQFSYLFGAAEGLLPEGSAYAEYARRGFAELVIIAMINIGLLLIGLHMIRPAGRVAEIARKALLTLLVSCTGVMLVSAYTRLSLYEEAYGYTQSRLLVHGFMIFLGVLMAVAIVRIWKSRFSLAKVYICLAIVAYVIMNYMNIDARIAENNIARYERGGEIDLHYLSTLSADAAPALIGLKANYPELEGLEQIIEEWRNEARTETDWQSWNYSLRRLNR